jgi:putative ABC transport system permease protein
LKIALKSLLKNKITSAITIIGFSIGITAAILIFLFILYELSYDKYIPESKNIYRVLIKSQESNGLEKLSTSCPPNTYFSLKNDIPEIESVTRLYKSWYPQEIKAGNNQYRENQYFWADEEFFNVFKIPFIYGNRETALKLPNSIVMTESIALRYFGNINPLESSVSIEGKDYKVTGVFKDIPGNSHFHPNFIVSFSTLDEKSQVYNQGLSFYTYFKLRTNVDLNSVSEKINKAVMHSIIEFIKGNRPNEKFSSELQPLLDIHLYSHTEYEIEPNGNITNVYIFTVLVIFILIIAAVNFINLMTSRSQERMKEIGVRKVIGADRIELIKQFLLESVLISFISFGLSLFLVELLINKFSLLVNRDLHFSLIGDIQLFLGISVMIMFLGFIAGLYPAIYLSGFKPTAIFKYGKTEGRKKLSLNKILLVVQFSIAIFLLSSLMIISNQMNFLKRKDLGFDKEHILVINNLTKKLEQSSEIIKNELLRSTLFASVAISQHVPGKTMSGQEAYREDQNENEAIKIFELRAGYDYLDTYGLKLLLGRDFSDKISTDKNSSIILNETAVKELGLKDPIDKILNLGWLGRPKIVGVVKDFNFESLYKPVKPLFIHIGLQFIKPENISIKIKPGNISGSIRVIEEKMKEFDPSYQFNYYFQENAFNEMYKSEERIQKLFTYSAFLAFFIGGMGLFALTNYSTNRRKKEIGIRKILGAPLLTIIHLVLKEYLVLIVLAFILASPISYFLLEKWLRNFAYRSEVNLSVFFLTAVITLIIIILTVSYQVIRTAILNPVDVLKHE